jgi:hypothetical protein
VTAGWNPTLVNTILDSIFSDAAWTPPAASYLQLHTGDPGPAGTANVSSFGSRVALTWSSASGGSKALSASVQITSSWSGTSPETITHVSYWDASTGGNFIVSDQVTAAITITTGQALNLPSATVPWSPLAA